MPPRDPTKVQLDFPQLVSDLIEQLQLTGTIGVLDFTPVVQPVFIIGDRDLSIEAVEPVFKTSEIFRGNVSNPAPGATIVDTGQLPAGDYDLWVSMSFAATVRVADAAAFEHRDAADAVNLWEWQQVGLGVGQQTDTWKLSIEVAENERFKIHMNAGMTGRIAGLIAARRRPTP